MTTDQLNRVRKLLCSLHLHIRDAVLAARTKDARHFAKIAAITAADTIYQVDKVSEGAIRSWWTQGCWRLKARAATAISASPIGMSGSFSSR